MKALFTIVLLSFTAFSAQAQYARLQAGILLGYDNAGFGSWNKSIEYYNTNFPLLPSAVDNFRTGKKAGIFGNYILRDGIGITAEFEYQRYQTSTSNFDPLFRYRPPEASVFEGQSTRPYLVNDLQVTVRNMENGFPVQLNPFLLARFDQIQFSAGAILYPFLIIPVQLDSRIKENFHLQITAGYGFRTNASIEYDPDPIVEAAAEPELVTVDGKGGLHLGVGAGYHLYLSDRFSVSPTFRITFSPMARFSGLAANLTRFTGADVDPNLSDNQTLLQTSIQLRAAYNILNRLPLCPINSCSVRSQHRHRELGEQVYRGNTHDKKQNPRYGQRHRGQRRKKVSDPNKGNK
jgi:hypothetical protein